MRTDTEMTPCSSELMSLEHNLYPLSSFDGGGGGGGNSKLLIIVLDTNIFISNLSQLKHVLSSSSQFILFAIPWIVLQELDRLKSANKYKNGDASLVHKAVKAIQFISNILDENNSSKVATNHTLKSNFLFETAIQVKIFFRFKKAKNSIEKILYFKI